MIHRADKGPAPSVFDDIDPVAGATFRALKRVFHLNRQLLMRTMAEKGGHPAQAGCLMALSHGEAPTQRDLAEQLHIAPATLTSMLQRMERQGVVERYTDEHDQRLTRVRITAEGRRLSKQMARTHATYIEGMLDGLSQAERHELTRLLTAVGDNIESELER